MLEIYAIDPINIQDMLHVMKYAQNLLVISEIIPPATAMDKIYATGP